VHGLSNALTLAIASPVKVDLSRERDSQDPVQLSKSKALAALLDALEDRDFTGATTQAVAAHPESSASHPGILPGPARATKSDLRRSSK
jgi:hypothetical protein